MDEMDRVEMLHGITDMAAMASTFKRGLIAEGESHDDALFLTGQWVHGLVSSRGGEVDG